MIRVFHMSGAGTCCTTSASLPRWREAGPGVQARYDSISTPVCLEVALPTAPQCLLPAPALLFLKDREKNLHCPLIHSGESYMKAQWWTWPCVDFSQVSSDGPSCLGGSLAQGGLVLSSSAERLAVVLGHICAEGTVRHCLGPWHFEFICLCLPPAQAVICPVVTGGHAHLVRFFLLHSSTIRGFQHHRIKQMPERRKEGKRNIRVRKQGKAKVKGRHMECAHKKCFH